MTETLDKAPPPKPPLRERVAAPPHPISNASRGGSFLRLKRWLRRYFGPTLREVGRTGRITQSLWDAAQLQDQEKQHYEYIGRQCAELIREGKLKNIRLERSLAKIDQIERILDRLEAVLQNHQKRGDLSLVLAEDTKKHEKFLDPV